MDSTQTHPWRILIVLCLTVLIVVIDNTIVNVALPSMALALHASTSGLQWIVDGYALPFSALMLAGGGVADRFGRRRVMTIALVLFVVASIGASQTQTLGQLIVMRALMGACAAFIFPATLSIITATFTDPRRRAAAYGIWGATAGIAVAVGPISGGELVTHYWFGSVFLVNLPVGIIALILILSVVPNSRSLVARAVDIVGVAAGTASLMLLTLAIIEGPSWGWGSMRTLLLFGGAVVVTVFFVRVELRTREPLFDVRVFANRHFSAGAIALVVNSFLLFGFIFLVTQYMQLVHGWSALSAGVRTLPFAVTTMVVTPIGALLAARIGAKYVVPAGLLAMSGSLWWIGHEGAHAAYVGPVMGSMMVLALGFSLVSPPSTSVTMGSLSSAQVTAGAAVNEATRELGGTLGVAVIGSLFASIFASKLHHSLSLTGLSSRDISISTRSMPDALHVASQVAPSLRASVQDQATSAFMGGFHFACLVAAGVGVVAAILTAYLLPAGGLPSFTPAEPAQVLVGVASSDGADPTSPS